MKKIASLGLLLLISLFSAKGEEIKESWKRVLEAPWVDTDDLQAALGDGMPWDLYFEHVNPEIANSVFQIAVRGSEELEGCGRDLLVNHQELLLKSLTEASEQVQIDTLNNLFKVTRLTDAYRTDFMAALCAQEWVKALVAEHGLDFPDLLHFEYMPYAGRTELSLGSVLKLLKVAETYPSGLMEIENLDILSFAFEYALDPDVDAFFEYIVAQQPGRFSDVSFLPIYLYPNIIRFADTKERLDTYVSKWGDLIEKLKVRFGYNSGLERVFTHTLSCKTLDEARSCLAETLLDCVFAMPAHPGTPAMLEERLSDMVSQDQLFEILVAKCKNLSEPFRLGHDSRELKHLLYNGLALEHFQKLFAGGLYDPKNLFFQRACVECWRLDVLCYLHAEEILRRHPALLVVATKRGSSESKAFTELLHFLIEELGLFSNNLLMLRSLMGVYNLEVEILEWLDQHAMDWAHSSIMESLLAMNPSTQKIEFLLKKGSSLATFEAVVGIAFSDCKTHGYRLHNLIPYLPSESIVAFGVLKEALEVDSYEHQAPEYSKAYGLFERLCFAAPQAIVNRYGKHEF